MLHLKSETQLAKINMGGIGDSLGGLVVDMLYKPFWVEIGTGWVNTELIRLYWRAGFFEKLILLRGATINEYFRLVHPDINFWRKSESPTRSSNQLRCFIRTTKK